MSLYRVSVRDLGRVGLLKDADPFTRPLNAWTDISNARFTPQGVGFVPPERPLLFTTAASNIATFRIGYSLTYGPGYIFGSTDKIWVRDSFGGLVDITRATGGAYGGANWRFEEATNGTYGGIIAANGVDTPQYYTGTQMANLPSWVAGEVSELLRPFKNFLVSFASNKVHWSDSIPSTSSLPNSWSVTDPAKDGGEQYLQTYRINDALALGDSMFIYTNRGAWEMRYIGAPFMFSFTKVFPELRILFDRCVARFWMQGVEHHFVLSGNDAFVHDGRQVRNVLPPELRKHLFENYLKANQSSVPFVVPRHSYKEMWCFIQNTSSGINLPNAVLMWNWETNLWKIRTAPADTYYYDGLYYEGRPDSIVLLTVNQAVTTRGFRDIAPLNDLTSNVHRPTLMVERKGLSPSKEGVPTPNVVKSLHSIRLWTQDIDSGHTITVQAGATMDSPETANYTVTKTFTPYTGQKHEDIPLDDLEGRWFAIKITVTPTTVLAPQNAGLIVGYDLEFTSLGEY